MGGERRREWYTEVLGRQVAWKQKWRYNPVPKNSAQGLATGFKCSEFCCVMLIEKNKHPLQDINIPRP